MREKPVNSNSLGIAHVTLIRVLVFDGIVVADGNCWQFREGVHGTFGPCLPFWAVSFVLIEYPCGRMAHFMDQSASKAAAAC